jgi:hypothetical protein
MGTSSKHTDEFLDEAYKAGSPSEQRDVIDPPLGPLNDIATMAEDKNTASKVSRDPRIISYRRSIEIRDSQNKRLDYYKIESEDPDYQDNNSEPFEYVKVYKIPNRAYMEANGVDQDPGKANRLHPSAGSTPEHFLRIFSTAIIHALRSIVTYYPSQDLNGDIIEIRRPYPVLVHHYDQLADIRDQRAGQDPATLCRREANAAEHLDSLLQFLDENIMPGVREEIERNKKGLYTFDYFWVPLQPGITSLERGGEKAEWIPSVVHSLTGGTFESPATRWSISQWSMSFDGTYMGRKLTTRSLSKFDGLEALGNSRILFDIDDIEKTMDKYPQVMEAVKHGEEYWKLLNNQCRSHMGETVTFPHNEASTNVPIFLTLFIVLKNSRSVDWSWSI